MLRNGKVFIISIETTNHSYDLNILIYNILMLGIDDIVLIILGSILVIGIFFYIYKNRKTTEFVLIR